MRLTASPSRSAWIAAALVPAIAASCSGSTSTSSPIDAGGDVSTQPVEAGEGASPGPDSSAPLDASDGGAADAPAEAFVVPGTNFAFRHYYLGDTDRSGTSSQTAWMQFGVNVDGLVTTASSSNVCTLAAGSSKVTQVDGNGGIDNSWGANIMPIFLTLDSSFSQT